MVPHLCGHVSLCVHTHISFCIFDKYTLSCIQHYNILQNSCDSVRCFWLSTATRTPTPELLGPVPDSIALPFPKIPYSWITPYAGLSARLPSLSNVHPWILPLIAMFGIYFYTLDNSIIQNPRDGPDEHLKRSLHLVFTDSKNDVIVHSIYTRQRSLTQQLIKNPISLSIRL